MRVQRVLTLDCETSVDNTVIGEDRASPFYKENTVVALGTKWLDSGSVSLSHLSDSISPRTHIETLVLSYADVLVGQNIRFDLHYLHKLLGDSFEEWLYNPEHLVWDTQLAEYLLTAQRHKYASLDELSAKYGGTTKDDKIKAYWDAGVRTEDIPKDELLAYLEDDVMNTELVYVQQLSMAEEIGMLPLIRTQMKALVATWEMMKNGMCFDMWRALDQADILEKKIAEVLENLQPLVDKAHPHSLGLSPTSNDVLSRMLFGGPYKYKTQEVVVDELGYPVVYKTGIKKGEVKTRSVEAVDYVKGLVEPDAEWAGAKTGFYSVGTGIVEELLSRESTPEEARTLLASVEFLRALVKDRETYFVGFSKLAWPQEEGAGIMHYIHGKLNHTSTDTGRLSSSSPNLQNLSNKERED